MENVINEEKMMEDLKNIKEGIEKLEKELQKIKNENNVKKLFEEIEKTVNDEEILVDSIIYIDNETVKFIAKNGGKNGNLIIDGSRGYIFDWQIYKVENGKVKINPLHHYVIPNNIIQILKEIPESSLEDIDPTLVTLYYFLKQGYKLTFYSLY